MLPGSDLHLSETAFNRSNHVHIYPLIHMRHSLLSFTYQATVHCLPSMMAFATQGSYGFNSKPISCNVPENRSYHCRAERTKSQMAFSRYKYSNRLRVSCSPRVRLHLDLPALGLALLGSPLLGLTLLDLALLGSGHHRGLSRHHCLIPRYLLVGLRCRHGCRVVLLRRPLHGLDHSL